MSDKEPTKPASEAYDLDSYVRMLAIRNILADLSNMDHLVAFLRRWWCRYYKRPYKDPMLALYTLEELLLEYYEILFLENHKERDKAQAEIDEFLHGDEDEAYLKEIMGENYITKEEMAQQFPTKKGGNT